MHDSDKQGRRYERLKNGADDCSMSTTRRLPTTGNSSVNHNRHVGYYNRRLTTATTSIPAVQTTNSPGLFAQLYNIIPMFPRA